MTLWCSSSWTEDWREDQGFKSLSANLSCLPLTAYRLNIRGRLCAKQLCSHRGINVGSTWSTIHSRFFQYAVWRVCKTSAYPMHDPVVNIQGISISLFSIVGNQSETEFHHWLNSTQFHSSNFCWSWPNPLMNFADPRDSARQDSATPPLPAQDRRPCPGWFPDQMDHNSAFGSTYSTSIIYLDNVWSTQWKINRILTTYWL